MNICVLVLSCLMFGMDERWTTFAKWCASCLPQDARPLRGPRATPWVAVSAWLSNVALALALLLSVLSMVVVSEFVPACMHPSHKLLVLVQWQPPSIRVQSTRVFNKHRVDILLLWWLFVCLFVVAVVFQALLTSNPTSSVLSNSPMA